MKKVFTYLVGGKAGEGIKKAGLVASACFSGMGRHVFQLDDYMSLIRGGHNFAVVSTSVDKIYSQYMKADLVVALDQRSYDMHKVHCSDDGVIVYNSNKVKADMGVGIPFNTLAKKYPRPDFRLAVGAVATMAAMTGLSEDELNQLIADEYPSDLENNQGYAVDVHREAVKILPRTVKLEKGDKKRAIMTGNETVALGAAAAGLDIYFAYPMTPASSILHYLAKHSKELGVKTIHAENEIAVANMAVGAASTGAKAMVGTSGGGFALMAEAFSFAGMTEAPFLCVLSQRPGPATGVPTYTEQGDLNFAIYQGHGEFPRIVASPATVEDAFYVTSEMLKLVWDFQTPGIVLTEKHLSESHMTIDEFEDPGLAKGLVKSTVGYKRFKDTKDGISPMMFPPSKEIIKWNSYEHDELGITTEDPEVIKMMKDKRNRKTMTMLSAMKKMKTVNVYGKEGPVIITYGSTTMSVLEALRAKDIKARVVQPIYVEPFPSWEFDKYKDEDIIVVEMSSTGHFATRIKEKTGLKIKKTILRYDGRPFDPDELGDELLEVLK